MLLDYIRKAFGHRAEFIGGGGGGGGDGGAAQREQQRQARIADGSAAVNNAFTGFDDNYYADIAGKHKGHYTPLIQEQYQKTLRQLPYSFASTQGSEYQRRLSELEADYQRQLVDYSGQAEQFANERRAEAERQRGNLIGQVTAGADPGTAATLAAGAVKSLSAQPTFSALGDLFAKYTANEANAADYARRNGQEYTPLIFGGNRKSVTTVN